MEDQTQSTEVNGPSMSGVLGTAEHVVGRRVKALRTARGWSQQELAKRMAEQGNSWRQTTVAKTEAADRPIRINEAQDLAVIFGITIQDLLSIPVEDWRSAAQAVRIAELRVLGSAALQRVRECERSHQRTGEELAEARAEAERISSELRGLEEEQETERDDG